MEEIADKNAHAFSESLKMLEAMDAVQQCVTNDMLVQGMPRHKVSSGATYAVDFRSYLLDYWLCCLMVDFAAWLRRLHEAHAGTNGSVIQSPSQDEVHVFGG